VFFTGNHIDYTHQQINFAINSAGKTFKPEKDFYNIYHENSFQLYCEHLLLLHLGIKHIISTEGCSLGIEFDFNGSESELTLDGLFYLKTSGSSGDAKFCEFHSDQIKTATELGDHFYQYQDIIWESSLPLQHVGGLMIWHRCFFQNQTVTTPVTKKANTFSLVPTQLEKYKNQDYFKNAKLIIISGSKITNTVAEESKGLPVSFSYGMTETLAQIAATPIKTQHQVPIQYTPFENVEIANKGTIEITSPTTCSAYGTSLDNLSKTNGRIKTQDLGRIENQLLEVFGRADRIIISGGKNISLDKVEKEIENFCSNESINCYGIPHKKWGEVLVCLSNIELNRDTLKNTNLEDFEIPHYFLKINELNFSGIKPSKIEIIDHLQKLDPDFVIK
jgi:acyl-CoA synthetase (AMP-forming)/AMP-acid ligase II